jgi:hypothetical protein
MVTEKTTFSRSRMSVSTLLKTASLPEASDSYSAIGIHPSYSLLLPAHAESSRHDLEIGIIGQLDPKVLQSMVGKNWNRSGMPQADR